MAKGVFKEIIIILLLCFAIILLLGVLLYGYVPMNKVIPQQVSYVATQDTKEALEEKKAADSDSVILTYEVTATDLSNYKKQNEYVAGRKNPFAPLPEEIKDSNSGSTSGTTGGSSSTGTNTGSTGNSSDSNNSNKGTTSGNNQSTGNSNSGSTNYYPDRGTK